MHLNKRERQEESDGKNRQKLLADQISEIFNTRINDDVKFYLYQRMHLFLSYTKIT